MRLINKKGMKKIFILFILISVSCYGISQQTGVKFTHRLSWKEIKAKAKAENKYIFVDCFTTWCGPCRMISTQVFPSKEVGTFFNKNFINVKAQMDKKPNDKDDVKARYADVDTITKIGKVVNYPTFLYFNPEGELIHRQVGAPFEPILFINEAKAALNSSTQYISLKKKFESTSDPDLALLHNMAIAFSRNGDTKNGDGEKAQQCADKFISKSNIKDLLTKDNIEFMRRFTRKVKDKGFEIFRQYGVAIDSVEGKKISRPFVEEIIFYSEVLPLVQVKSKLDWTKIKEVIHSRWPEFSDMMIAKARISYFREHKEWKFFVEEVEIWLQIKANILSKNDLNEYAWTICSSCKEGDFLRKALEWNEIALERDETDISSLLTRASLLYVLERNEEALEYGQKAVSFAEEGDKEYAEELLNEMKKGQKIEF